MKKAKILSKQGELIADAIVWEAEGSIYYDIGRGTVSNSDIELLELIISEYDEPALIRHEVDYYINVYQVTEGYYCIAHNTHEEAKQMQKDFNDGFQSFKFLTTRASYIVYDEEVT